jgi:hypothetical protein
MLAIIVVIAAAIVLLGYVLDLLGGQRAAPTVPPTSAEAPR